MKQQRSSSLRYLVAWKNTIFDFFKSIFSRVPPRVYFVSSFVLLSVIFALITARYGSTDLDYKLNDVVKRDIVSPESYGEKPLRPELSGHRSRDRLEIDLFRACMEQQKPVLGISRGAQIMNVAMGGTLYQDISLQVKEATLRKTGEISLGDTTLLFEPMSTEVNVELHGPYDARGRPFFSKSLSSM